MMKTKAKFYPEYMYYTGSINVKLVIKFLKMNIFFIYKNAAPQTGVFYVWLKITLKDNTIRSKRLSTIVSG